MQSAGQSGGDLATLLAGAVGIWGLGRRVWLSGADGGSVLLRSDDGVEISVTAEDGQDGTRWRVEALTPPPEGGPGRRRVTRHAGVPGMLRTVRAALAPEQRAGRMIVAPAPGRE